jgi:NhaP-type Na+/H+ or K+/H+ antiporter
MNNVHQLFQGFVAPAIFVSAEGLLLLSLNVRLMGIVSRLRSYLHEKHHATRHGRPAESEAYAAQIASIERRAELIRRAFVLTLYGLIGTIAACLLLGAGLYWPWAERASAIVFVVSILSLLVGMVYYAREVQVALSSVREEVADSRFMDIEDRAEVPGDKELPIGM